MGYWGDGFFENDYSLCTLSNIVAPFAARIDDLLADSELAQWDEVYIDEMVILMRIFILMIGDGAPISDFPDLKKLKRRRASFESEWQESELNEFQMKRLEDIFQTWDRMISIVENSER